MNLCRFLAIIFCLIYSPCIGQDEIKALSDSVFYLKSNDPGEVNCEGIYTNHVHPNPDYQKVYEGGYRPFGKVICYYPNGQVQSKSFFDSLSQYHGLYESFDENGDTAIITNYLHGVRHGLEIVYNEGKILSKDNYKLGKRHGKCYFFYENSIEETDYVQGNKEGKRVETSLFGQLLSSYMYKNDTLNGDFYKYHDSRNFGESKWIGTYKNGELEGRYLYYYGNNLESTFYVNGELEGKCITTNGKIKIEEKNYLNGDLHGAYFFYTDKGKLWSKGQYVNGKKEGEWIEYDENTKKINKKEFYKNGVLVGG